MSQQSTTPKFIDQFSTLSLIHNKLMHARAALNMRYRQDAIDLIVQADAALLKGILQGFIIETSPDSNIAQNKEEEPTQHELEKQTAEKMLHIQKELTP